MLLKSKQFRLSVHGSRPPVPSQGLIGRTLTGVVGVAALAGAFVVSAFLFAVAAAGMLLLGGYLWWTTRELRRRLRAMTQEERVIEGEVMRDDTSRYSALRGTQSKIQRIEGN